MTLARTQLNYERYQRVLFGGFGESVGLVVMAAVLAMAIPKRYVPPRVALTQPTRHSADRQS